mgnify:CR=1 FL=1
MNRQGSPDRIRVEVVLAMPERQLLVELELPAGSSLLNAIEASSITDSFDGFELDLDKLGIFGKKMPPEQVLQDGDRVEIYRPLLADPKESRRQRAIRQNRKTTGR